MCSPFIYSESDIEDAVKCERQRIGEWLRSWTVVDDNGVPMYTLIDLDEIESLEKGESSSASGDGVSNNLHAPDNEVCEDCGQDISQCDCHIPQDLEPHLHRG